MKKLAALFLSLAMVWSLAACSSATLSSEESGSGTGGASSGKTLVVYYSATGNTEAVANYIADATGGDLFELEPVEPYTDEELEKLPKKVQLGVGMARFLIKMGNDDSDDD